MKLPLKGYIKYNPSGIERTLTNSLRNYGYCLSNPEEFEIENTSYDLEPVIQRRFKKGDIEMDYQRWIEEECLDPYRNTKGRVLNIPITKFAEFLIKPLTYREVINFEGKKDYFALFFKRGKLNDISWEHTPSEHILNYLNNAFNLDIKIVGRTEDIPCEKPEDIVPLVMFNPINYNTENFLKKGVKSKELITGLVKHILQTS